jgi:hypothetical protein
MKWERLPCPPRAMPRGRPRLGPSHGRRRAEAKFRSVNPAAWLWGAPASSAGRGRLGYRLKDTRTICRTGAAQPCDMRLPRCSLPTMRLGRCPCTKLKPLEIPSDVSREVVHVALVQVFEFCNSPPTRYFALCYPLKPVATFSSPRAVCKSCRPPSVVRCVGARQSDIRRERSWPAAPA